MFERWGRWAFRHRVGLLVASGVLLVLSGILLARGGRLSHGIIHGTESDRAAQIVSRELHTSEGEGFVIIFSSEQLTTDDEAYQRDALRAVAPLRRDPRIRSVRTAFDDDVSMFLGDTWVSIDGHHTLAFVTLQGEAATDTRHFPEIRALIRPRTLHATVTGLAAFQSDLDRVLESDLIRAEVFAIPVAVIVLLLVFGSLVAAGLPVGVGGLAVAGGMACVFALSRTMEVAQYAVNVVSLLGLGVAIDYSLFVVDRFREELARGHEVEDALARSVATAGRAVAFSGVAVAIGLSGLLFFRGSYLASIGLGGTVVVLFAVVYALTFLPALLGVLGHRVNSGRIRLPALSRQGDMWHHIANFVMRHPVRILVPTLIVLVVAGTPFTRLELATPDINVLPPTTEAHQGYELMRREFPERVRTRIVVVARFPGRPLASPARISALYDLSRRIARIRGVDSVESVVDADSNLDRAGYVETLSGPAELQSEGIQVARAESVGQTIVILSAMTEHAPASQEARRIVWAIRTTRGVADGEVLVTGATAVDVDTTAFMFSHVPEALAFVGAATLILLFVLLGSVVLPVKALVMNLLSITGSFGALVWIFQDGNFAGVLDFVPGPIEPTLPIVMFCATFGLSMDYEVLLLSRMHEEYHRGRDNTAAVAEGLAKSGRLITSAAAIMVVVFVAFTLADIVLLKAVGVGMAIAVTLDATVVRLLVVPATMRLFGKWNWWAPASVVRLSLRLAHISPAEDARAVKGNPDPE